MPRPPARTRAASSRLANRDTRTEPASGSNAAGSGGKSSDSHGVSDRETRRIGQSSSNKTQAAAVLEASRREPSVSSDVYGVSDRELKRRATLRNASANSTLQIPAAAQDDEDEALGNSDGGVSQQAGSKLKQSHAPSSAVIRGSPPVDAGMNSQVLPRPRRAPDASAMDVLDDEMFGDMDTSFDDPIPDSPLIAHSAETSSFNIGLFRRGRPRQSSIVSKEDGPIRPSSRGANTPGLSSTFNLGRFKRRQREPSILGARRRERAEHSEVESAFESDIDGIDGGTFAPGAESTPPLDRSRAAAPQSSVREASNVGVSTRSRKRKSEEGQSGPSKRQAADSDDDVHQSIEVPASSPARANAGIRPSTPPMDDSIMAPPASSGSSAASPSMWPSLNSLAHVHRGRRAGSRARKTPTLDGDVSDISSPPSLRHSPNNRASRAAAKGKGGDGRREPSPVTTAALTSLLPKRRKKTRDYRWDVDSEEESQPSDDPGDELGRGRQRRTRPNNPTKPLAPASNIAAQTSKPRTARPSRRKYGSRNFSDKENQAADGDSIEVPQDSFSPLPDDTFDSPGPDETATDEIADELKKAARKF